MKTNIKECISDINYAWDGPVTQFVAINRALLLHGEYTLSTIANALDEVLSGIQSNGQIPSSEMDLQNTLI